MADELLRALGRVEREQRERAREQAATDESARALLRPLAEDERADLLARVMNQLAAQPAAASAALTDASPSASSTPAFTPPASTSSDASAPPASASSTPPPPSAQPIPLTPRRRTRWLAGLGSLAAAAVVLVLVLRPGDETSADLPEYALVRGGGDASTRSGDAPVSPQISLRSDSAVDLVLAPGSQVGGKISARLIAARGDELRWLDPNSVEVSSDGAIRLRGARAWDLPPGRWTLTVLISRPERAPADLDAYRRDAATRDWQRVQLELEVRSAS